MTWGAITSTGVLALVVITCCNDSNDYVKYWKITYFHLCAVNKETSLCSNMTTHQFMHPTLLKSGYRTKKSILWIGQLVRLA